jgi:coenzyme F420-0:L-glutamate ligase / coenzyme F420-1:gamma-L-glutamate ligase
LTPTEHLGLRTTDRRPAGTLHDWLRSRRSVRRFRPEAVDPEILTRILETATHAPSAHNRQPWRFVILTQPDPKMRLGDAMAAEFWRDMAADGLPAPEIDALVTRSKERIRQAPVVVVLCMDAGEMDAYPDERRRQAERLMAVQSTALAGLQLQLAAHAEGLGTVWVCAPLFAPQAVRLALNLPEAWEAQSMFFLGYADGEPKPKAMQPLANVVKYI